MNGPGLSQILIRYIEAKTPLLPLIRNPFDLRRPLFPVIRVWNCWRTDFIKQAYTNCHNPSNPVIWASYVHAWPSPGRVEHLSVSPSPKVRLIIVNKGLLYCKISPQRKQENHSMIESWNHWLPRGMISDGPNSMFDLDVKEETQFV